MAETLKKFWLVAKPGIIVGNLITAAGGFFLAAKGSVEIALLLPTISGIALVVASACVINNCLDKNTDRKMVRTCRRVLARGRMSLKAALCYAVLLCLAGFTLLGAATNLLCVAIVLAGFAVYVGLYSLYLKRHSVYGTLIGSLAGAAPPLAAYCAVRNTVDAQAVILLLIFSLWQMPHCYAIAIFLGGYTGYGYLAVVAVLGLLWLIMACSGYKTPDDRRWAKKLLVFSIVNIFTLSVMMSIDCAPY